MGKSSVIGLRASVAAWRLRVANVHPRCDSVEGGGRGCQDGAVEVVPILVIFVLGAIFVSWWGRRERAVVSGGLEAAAETLGLRLHSDPHSDEWLSAAPSFRFLASGLARQVLARAGVPGAGEVLLYRRSSQTSSHRVDHYAIYSERLQSPVASFSLVAKDLLDTRRRDQTITLTPLDGWTDLERRSLWMHTDATRAANGALPQALLMQLGGELAAGIGSRVEFVGGVLVHYVPVANDFSPEDIGALIDRGRRYSDLLRTG